MSCNIQVNRYFHFSCLGGGGFMQYGDFPCSRIHTQSPSNKHDYKSLTSNIVRLICHNNLFNLKVLITGAAGLQHLNDLIALQVMPNS